MVIEVLPMPGIDTSSFTVHSTATISASKTDSVDMPAKEILRYSTFQKYYCKVIINEQLKKVLAI